MTSSTCTWLPEIELLSDHSGNWDAYLDAIYLIFTRDFIDSKPVFRGKRLGLKKHPISAGKEATFWHFISEGAVEAERTPDIRRMERIRWPRPIIENERDPLLKVWSEIRNGNERVHIWFESEGYIVVIDQRKDYCLPWTAFYIEKEHQRRKYNKRWERYRE